MTKQGWISVKQRAPDKNGMYLVCSLKTHVPIAIKSFYDGNFYRAKKYLSHMNEARLKEWFSDAATYKTITHWMELPKYPGAK